MTTLGPLREGISCKSVLRSRSFEKIVSCLAIKYPLLNQYFADQIRLQWGIVLAGRVALLAERPGFGRLELEESVSLKVEMLLIGAFRTLPYTNMHPRTSGRLTTTPDTVL